MRLKQQRIELPPSVDIIEVQVEQIDPDAGNQCRFRGGSVTRREKKRVKGKLSTRRLGFAAPIWMTFNQANELKSNVRKGSKGSLVVYADRITKTEIAEHGEETERDIYFMKAYTVFNVEQTEGLPPHFTDRRQLHFPTATITFPHQRVPLYRLLSRPVMS